jgi:hypothetical protein
MWFALCVIALLFLFVCDLVGLLGLATPDWTVYWTAATAFATAGLGFVAWYQIREIERQQRGWETLRVCNQFDLDPTLVETRKRLSAAWKGKTDPKEELEFDLRTLLNFFDAIAIGLDQGFYKEDVVQAHLQRIMLDYRSNLLSDDFSKTAGISDLSVGYSSFLKRIEKWGTV